MPKLTIPQRNRDGLSKFLALRDESFEQLIAKLKDSSPSLSLVSRVPEGTAIPEISKADSDEIVSAIVSLCVVRWSQNVPLDVFTSDVSDAIATFNPAGASEDARQRISRILSVEPLAIASKAFVIFSDYQRTLHSAKILTDLRYVFRTDPDEEPYGAVIVHLLKLTYHEDTGHKEFFVAMDDGDLALLKSIVERAEKKARTLRRKLKAAGTEYLGNAE